MTSDQLYSHVANAYLNTTSCGSFTTVPGDLVPVDDLVTIFKSASSTPERPDAPQGARATVTALFADTRASNQMFAEKANKLGVSILSVGNDNDFLFDPKACSITLRSGVGFPLPGVFPLPDVNVTLTDVDFTDTQLLEDGGDGSRLYGRFFTATAPKTCGTSSDISASHFAVLTDKTVQTALSHFLRAGATPIPLPGKRGGN